jgi:PAT family beta-lactamase induction signal transducer AmpG
MALLMAVGSRGDVHARANRRPACSRASRTTQAVHAAGMFDAVVGPFVAFFRDHGKLGAADARGDQPYRLPDFCSGRWPIRSTPTSASPRKPSARCAARSAWWRPSRHRGRGLCAVRFGFMPTLRGRRGARPGSNLAFSYLALHGATRAYSRRHGIDNFCNGFARVALVGYMSSLTNVGYTATHTRCSAPSMPCPARCSRDFAAGRRTLEAAGTPARGLSLFLPRHGLLGIPAWCCAAGWSSGNLSPRPLTQ